MFGVNLEEDGDVPEGLYTRRVPYHEHRRYTPCERFRMEEKWIDTRANA